MQNKDNLVSIITPLYNGERYIKKTIESVQAQTYEDWEMIIVDDGSTDDSAKIIKELAAGDNRIHYHKNEVNLGAAESRNRAIEIAEGRYIAFLDSDDIWRADKLGKQISYMKSNGTAFCFAACEVIDENGDSTGKVRNVPLKVDFEGLLKGNVIPCLTVVLDKTQFTEIVMPKMGHEDYATWLTLLKECEFAEGINEVLGSYRIVKASLSGNKLLAAKWTWKIYRYVGLPVGRALGCFVSYALNGAKKYF